MLELWNVVGSQPRSSVRPNQVQVPPIAVSDRPGVSCARRVAYWEGRIEVMCAGDGMRGPSDVVSCVWPAMGASDVLRAAQVFEFLASCTRLSITHLTTQNSHITRIKGLLSDERRATTMSPSSLSPGHSPNSPGQVTTGLPKPKPKVRSSLPRPRTSSTAGLRTPATPGTGRAPPTPGTPATPTLRKPSSMRGGLGLAKSPSLTKLAAGTSTPKTRPGKHVRQRSSLSALSAVETGSTPQSRTASIDLTDVREPPRTWLTIRS